MPESRNPGELWSLTRAEAQAIDVVVHGRQRQSQWAFSLLVGVVVVGSTALGAARMMSPTAGGTQGRGAAGFVAVALVVLLLAAFVVRRTVAATAESTRLALRDSAPHADSAGGQPGDTDKVPPSPGTIICCSGGGVKSASFCMGALQRLSDQPSLWDDVGAIVGVSGGGYMASAWTVAACRTERDSRSRIWSPDRVEALRARTDYLASSGRVRFDLTLSLLFGIAVNLVLLAGPLVTIGWLVGGYAVDTGLDSSGVLSKDKWWATAPSLLLLLAAVTLFLSQRFGWGGRLTLILRPVGRAYWRLVAGPGAARDDSERLRFWAEAPNTLFGLSLGYFVAVPMLIWFARDHTQVVTSVSTFVHYLYTQRDAISWLVAVLAAMLGLSRSGARSPAMERGVAGTAWRLLRRRVAPWIALLIIGVFGYWATALLTAREMEAPLTGWWAFGAAGALLLIPLCVAQIGSANTTSFFMFYRDRLAYAYLCPAWDAFGSNPDPVTVTPPEKVPLSAVTGSPTVPELVLMSTANAFGAGYLPSGRNGTPFVLSAEVGYAGPVGPFPRVTQRADTYELARRQSITVADAMAISGAAISPQAGRESKNLGGYRTLLALANIRLGAWAPNPYFGTFPQTGEQTRWRRLCVRASATILDHNTALYVVREAFGALRLDTPYVYLTDGGHYDNLGLVEALRRRPRLVYLLDGTGDAEDSFAAVGDAIATARMDLGVEISFPDPDSLRRGKRDAPPRAWAQMRATDPDDPSWSCDILYIKAILPDGFTFDLYAFQKRNPGFPTDLGRIEMLDEFDFEAYRQLGWCAVDSALSDGGLADGRAPGAVGQPGGGLSDPGPLQRHNQVGQLVKRLGRGVFHVAVASMPHRHRQQGPRERRRRCRSHSPRGP